MTSSANSTFTSRGWQRHLTTILIVAGLLVSVAAFGGAFLWEISPATNLLTAFGFGILGTLWFALCGSDLSVEQRKAREAQLRV